MDSVPDLPSDEDFARIEGELFERIERRHRSRVLRHRIIAGAAVLVVAGLGIAAGTVANTGQRAQFAYCYAGSTTGSRVVQLALPKPSGSNGSSRASTAVEQCAAAWRGGVLSSHSGSAPYPVPKLQACLRDDLVISVFRRPSSFTTDTAFCENLGLSAP